MGTSRNDRSPLTPGWRMTMAVLGRTDVPASSQNTEIWRAVTAERAQQLLHDFSNPALAEACRMVDDKLPVHEALSRFSKATKYERDSGLALEMGKRALARSTARQADAREFVGELFAEAVSYYAARDLPSFVAAHGRVASTSEAIRLKEDLRKATRRQVRAFGRPSTDKRLWRRYIAAVIKSLRAGGNR